MSLPVLILGGGGHARVLIEALRCAGATVLGVIDPKSDVARSLPAGIRYLGAEFGVVMPSEAEIAIGVGSVSVGAENPRPRLYREVKRAGFAVRSIRHPGAVVASDAVLGEGAQIMAGAILQPGVVIGANCIVNTGASIDHDSRLADHVHVAPGAVLSGNVSIGEGCHIGTGAAIIHGITVGAETLIPAGAVVTRDIAAGTRLEVKQR